MENWWMVDFTVRTEDKPKAVELSLELDRVYRDNPKDVRIPDLVEKLRKLRIPASNERTPLQTWEHGAFQLNNYTGNGIVMKELWELHSSYAGRILEAMCGHTSYYPFNIPAQEVTALDYCEASLERYPIPERTRICADLNELGPDSHLPFADESFDVISVCFGYKYPDDIVAVLREFSRTLSPTGTVSFVENEKHGYENLLKRWWKLDEVQENFRIVFPHVNINRLSVPEWDDQSGAFYHIEAKRQLCN
jgi:SAM-dependent methyltransferase